jgi:hypothetical protein
VKAEIASRETQIGDSKSGDGKIGKRKRRQRIGRQ